MAHLILLVLDRTHTQHVGLCAVNLNDPVDVLSVLFFCRRLSSLCLLCFLVFFPGFPAEFFSWPGVSSLFSLLFSLCLSLALDLCVRLGSCLLFLLSAVMPFVRPRVFLSLSLSLSLSSLFVVGCPRVSRLALSCEYARRVGECLCSVFFLFLLYIS